MWSSEQKKGAIPAGGGTVHFAIVRVNCGRAKEKNGKTAAIDGLSSAS
jgi:RNA 3'-terminal phosphate cyclase